MAGWRRKKGGKAGFENPYCGPSRYADWWIWIHQSRDLEGLLLVKGTDKRKVWHKAQYFVIGTYEHVCGKHNRENYKNVKKILFNRCTGTPSSCSSTSLFSARN